MLFAETNLISPEAQVSAGVIILALIGLLTMIIKWLLKLVGNDLRHLKERIEKLPCDDHERQLTELKGDAKSAL